jgi:hypothetical protein
MELPVLIPGEIWKIIVNSGSYLDNVLLTIILRSVNKWLSEVLPPIPQENRKDTNRLTIFDNALSNNFTSVVEWLTNLGYKWGDLSVFAATSCPCLDSLIYLYERGVKFRSTDLFAPVVANKVEYLKFMMDRGAKFDPLLMVAAAIHSSYECFVYMYENVEYSIDVCVMKNIAISNDYKLAEYIINNTDDDDDIRKLAKAAIEYDNVDMLRWCHKHGVKLNEHLLSVSALNGMLNCLRYIHENGVELVSTVTSLAVICGHLDVFKYAVMNGCPVSNVVLTYGNPDDEGRVNVINWYNQYKQNLVNENNKDSNYSSGAST